MARRHLGLGRTRTKTIYNEKYVSRAFPVTSEEALKIAGEASVIYAVEQGTIELPDYENQKRMVCVMRFERIVPKD